MGLRIEPLTAFDDRARADLAPTGALMAYQAAQETRHAALFAVLENGTRVGSVLLQREEAPGEVEVLVWAAAAQSGIDVLRRAIPHLERMARNVGACRLKFYTERAGLARVMLGLTDARALLVWDI